MKQQTPKGDLLLRTLAMPADTNANGDIFGGWIMSQMDIAGGILAKETARGRTVTVAVDGMTFHKPVAVGDAVCIYGEVVKLGKTSMKIHLEVWAKPLLEGHDDVANYLVTEGMFIYVSIDDNKKPKLIEVRNEVA
ncbi:acyl-CoA thioester hydrolase YciA [Flammeovirga pacifica]|uniref:Acyl-CoA thioesterase n=1 Tax=Flammeovirga pacifica TaxID=915059 RepID=A0A1S1YV71_FLAPC|nr:acyl-CoA thioester hydrolase YciA [Flammeovirga pacifica]OHX64919.1 acyl-CoA thioesterase [Flammeovirga pacifica]